MSFRKKSSYVSRSRSREGNKAYTNYLKDESYVELVIDLINLVSVKVVSFGLIAHQLPLQVSNIATCFN